MFTTLCTIHLKSSMSLLDKNVDIYLSGARRVYGIVFISTFLVKKNARLNKVKVFQILKTKGPKRNNQNRLGSCMPDKNGRSLVLITITLFYISFHYEHNTYIFQKTNRNIAIYIIYVHKQNE